MKGDLSGKEIQKRGDVRVHVADIHCAAETNNIVKHLYFNSKERNQPPGAALNLGETFTRV